MLSSNSWSFLDSFALFFVVIDFVYFVYFQNIESSVFFHLQILGFVFLGFNWQQIKN